MSTKEIFDFSKQGIAGLIANGEVMWFVDANVIISREAEKLFSNLSRVSVTEDVLHEVRKRPECKDANKFVDDVEEFGEIVSEISFPEIEESVKFLIDCSMSLAPGIRVKKQQLIETSDMSSDEAEIKAIEIVADEGWFFECGMIDEAVKKGLLSEEDAAIDKATRRSWYKYPRKRREKQKEGDYRFSDERLLAFAVACAILNKAKICVLSNDTDCAAIMKQMSDNIIWTASAMDCEITKGRAILSEVRELWENRCQNLNRYRERDKALQFKNAFDSIENGDFDPSQLYEPVECGILICRTNGHVSRFAYPEEIVNFVRNIGSLNRRCSLTKKGFWLPS